MNRWYIGDIHGCLDELVELDAMLPEGDERVFVGDLVDRGPDSLGVLAYMMQAGYTVVRGNHDDKLMRYLKGNPVQRAEAWWDDAKPYLGYLQGLPLSVQHEGVTALHGGVLPKHKRRLNKSCMYIRHVTPGGRQVRLGEEGEDTAFWTEQYDNDPFLGTVVYGHQPWPEVRITTNTVGVDTGCVFGGHLSAYCPQTGIVIAVKAKRKYAEPHF